MNDFEVPAWFYYLEPYHQTLYVELYQQIPLIYANGWWDNETRNGALTKWCFDGQGAPDVADVTARVLKFRRGCLVLQFACHASRFQFLREPGGNWLASNLFYDLHQWLTTSPDSALFLNDAFFQGIYGERIYAGYGMPMQWFLRTSLVPAISFIMHALTWSPRPAVDLMTPALFATFIYKTGPPHHFRILPETVSILWKDASLLNEEYTEETETIQFSGMDMLNIHLNELVVAVQFKTGAVQLRDPSIRRRAVGIFPFIHNIPGLNLERYQVYGEEQLNTLPEGALYHCLVWALNCAGISTDIIHSIAAFIPGRIITLTSLEKMATKLPFSIELTYATNAAPPRVSKKIIGTNGPTIRLGLVHSHIFINEKVPITPLYIQHAQELPPNAIGHTNLRAINRGYPVSYHATPIYDSFEIVQYLSYHASNYLRTMSFYEMAAAYRKVLDLDEFSLSNLNYYAPLTCRQFHNQVVSPQQEVPAIWFADFESFVTGQYHEPFLLCYSDDTETYPPIDCFPSLAFAINRMLDDVHHGIIYFHNLSYDGSFLLRVLTPERNTIVEYGSNRLLSFQVHHNGQIIEFRDSLAILPFPLRDFDKMLGIEIAKEMMPYTAYNSANYHSLVPLTLIEGVDLYAFETSVRTANALDEDSVNMWKYACYYCSRDVDVLRQGFFKMNQMMIEATHQPLWSRLTAPSLAFHSLRLKGVFEGCEELTGTPAFLIRKTAVGGRCMLRRNQKQFIQKPISDFDAVSLYPSAMALLYTLKGKPKPITNDQLDNWEQAFPKWDGFFVEIEITKVNRELDFPLISYKIDGKRTFNNEPGTLWVNDITLADLIEFHQIEYIPLRGYYYDEGKNYTLQQVITDIFNLRLQAKAEHKAIEVVYKLLMNSCYGKTIMKPRHYQKNIMTKEQLYESVSSKPFTLISYTDIDDHRCLAKHLVDALSNWSFPTLGSHVLAMSKRIVTRVTSLAQDLGIGVYYTDTDSIHIDKDRVQDLADAFRVKYNQELIGKQLGQFHTDFPTTDLGMMWSKTFIGVGKKAYIDLLTDGITNQYHIRMKGIPEASILKFCERAEITPEELYKRFYNDPEYSAIFDICDAKPAFSRKTNYMISTLQHFTRRISFPSL